MLINSTLVYYSILDRQPIVEFLTKLSEPLIAYGNDATVPLVQELTQLCSEDELFMQCVQMGCCADKETQQVFLITQDFLYGLNELNHTRCACDEPHDATKARAETMTCIKLFAERMITLFDIEQFQNLLFADSVPQEFADFYTRVLQAFVQKELTVTQALDGMTQFRELVDAQVLSKAELFLRYFSLIAL